MKTSALRIVHLLLFAVAGLSGCQADSEGKKIGIQLWSVREAMQQDPEGTLAALGDMGYTFVEAAGYENGLFYGMEPEVFRDLVEASGMVFLSSHTGRDIPKDSDDRAETMAWWDECIQAHADAGVRYIVQPWMGPSGYRDLEGLQAFCDYFNAIGEKCNEADIRFGYHNHAEEFGTLEGLIIYDYMLENTDPGKVFFQIDLYWVHKGGADPVHYFKEYPGRFIHWHVKDEEEVGASGKIDFGRIYAFAGTAGLKHSIVEVEKYNYDPLESVRISLEYLQQAPYVP